MKKLVKENLNEFLSWEDLKQSQNEINLRLKSVVEDYQNNPIQYYIDWQMNQKNEEIGYIDVFITNNPETLEKSKESEPEARYRIHVDISIKDKRDKIFNISLYDNQKGFQYNVWKTRENYFLTPENAQILEKIIRKIYHYTGATESQMEKVLDDMYKKFIKK